MTPAPIKPTVPFSAVDAIDVRVGTILSVDEVPKSEKLLRLRIDDDFPAVAVRPGHDADQYGVVPAGHDLTCRPACRGCRG